MIRILCNIAACWPGSSGIQSPADKYSVLYNSMLALSCIKSPADQDPVLYNFMLTRSFAIKSPVYQDPVLHNSTLARFVWYEVAC